MAIRILHLDGDPGFCASVQSLLESEGMEIEVSRARSEREFQAALDADACDLILAESTPRDFEGLTALKQARRRRPLVPFIYLSATPSAEAAAASLRMGAADYLAKSDLYRLAPTIERVLRASLEIQALQAEKDEAELEAKKAAEEASRAKGLFMAKVSHEIRTPMNGVVSMAKLLAETSLDPKQRQYVKVIQASAGSLERIVDDILDFSKGERGRLRLESRPFDMQEAAAEIVALLEDEAREKGLDLRWSFSSGTPRMVKGDLGRLRQILVNLVGNAIKFTDRGWVELRIAPLARSEGIPGLSFEVEDTGIGIEGRAVANLFQPFVQMDGSDTRRYGGTGMGLAICRQLAELMGGAIGVVSEPGRGSVFRVDLPLEAYEGRAPEPASQLVPHDEFRGLRILVAEDNGINQVVIASLLEALGCRKPEMVGNGQEAVAAFREGGFDLIFMDCQMPEMDGYAATNGIRRLEAGRGTDRRCYITAMTADVMPGVEEKCHAAGMDGYLAKPFLMEDLVATLERAWALAKGGAYRAAPPAPAPAAPAPPGGGGDVDLRILERLRMLGEKESPSIFRKLVQSFLESSAGKLAALRATADVPDFRALAFAAHSLKGMSLNFGALSMARQCEALQVAAEAERTGDLPHLLENLAAAEARTRAVLETMIGTGAAEAAAPSGPPGSRGTDG